MNSESRLMTARETGPVAIVPPTTRAISADDAIDMLSSVVTKGDLSLLSTPQLVAHYIRVCESVGLNPYTKPFDVLTLNNKKILYCNKGGADQLREVHGVNTIDLRQEITDGLCIVTIKVQDRKGRIDQEIGAVTIDGLKGEARANALMKALTKAKRRATLSLTGLGMLDETEVETIPGARTAEFTEITEARSGPTLAIAPDADTAASDADDPPRALAAFHAVGADLGLDHDDLRAFMAWLSGRPIDRVTSMATWSADFTRRATRALRDRSAEFIASQATEPIYSTAGGDVETGLEGAVRRPLRPGEFVDEFGQIVPAEDADDATVSPTTPQSLLADENMQPRSNPDRFTN